MKVSYDSKKLEKILTNERLIKKHYSNFYIKLLNRLSEIKAAKNLNDIPHFPPPRRHKLTQNFSDCWGIDVSKNFRIILKPDCDYDEYDLTTIDSIMIVSIEDYH